MKGTRPRRPPAPDRPWEVTQHLSQPQGGRAGARNFRQGQPRASRSRGEPEGASKEKRAPVLLPLPTAEGEQVLTRHACGHCSSEHRQPRASRGRRPANLAGSLPGGPGPLSPHTGRHSGSAGRTPSTLALLRPARPSDPPGPRPSTSLRRRRRTAQDPGCPRGHAPRRMGSSAPSGGAGRVPDAAGASRAAL